MQAGIKAAIKAEKNKARGKDFFSRVLFISDMY